MNLFDKALNMLSPEWRARGHRILREVVAVFSAVRDPAVPWKAKAVALGSLAYLLLPVDIIPDFIPVLGWLDDLALIPLACYLAAKMVPPNVMGRFRDEADFKLMRWGPAFKKGVIIFVLLWVLLAVVGGCMVMRGDGGKAEKRMPDWQERMTRELQQETR